MCGIAGIIGVGGADESRRELVQRMCGQMLHRGPDDGGITASGPAVLGMRRLAIFDPANGRQPMISPDGRHHLVFNGAIYNHRGLRADCAQRGWEFHTNCDTEVLLAMLAQLGESTLPLLRGMFAFALWDARDRTLLCARDAFGQKPFVYHSQPDGTLLFASEARVLLASGQVPADVDAEAAVDFLRWQSIPAPRTLYRGLRALRPGGLLRWAGGRTTVSTWWTPAAAIGGRRWPPALDAEGLRMELRSRLEETVRAHSLADVPVGTFLSGGLDSAIITALLAREHGAGLRTFSIGFNEAGWSESDEAAATAKHLGTDHHSHILTGETVASDLPDILAQLDQPTGDGLNTYYVAQAASAGGIKVALSGLGSDELFGGYPSFRRLPRLGRIAPHWCRLPQPLRRATLLLLDHGDTRARKLATSLRAASSAAALALAQRAVLNKAEIRHLMPQFVRAADAPHPATDELDAAWGRLESNISPTRRLETLASLAETCGYMADLLLRDADEFSMWHSLELRVPFVDRPLVEWAWAQDPRLLRPRCAAPKSQLAVACADLLPPGLLQRRKRGFSLPFALWLRGPLRPFMEETFAPASAGRSGLFDAQAPGRLWAAFLRGRDQRAWSRLWSLAVLIHMVNRA